MTDRPQTDRQTSCHGIVRAMNTRRAVKTCDCRRVFGSSLLGVRCLQHLGGMRPIVLTSSRYIQMPLCHDAVDLEFITDDDAKMLKMQYIFAYNGLPSPMGGCPVTYILESLRAADVEL